MLVGEDSPIKLKSRENDNDIVDVIIEGGVALNNEEDIMEVAVKIRDHPLLGGAHVSLAEITNKGRKDDKFHMEVSQEVMSMSKKLENESGFMSPCKESRKPRFQQCEIFVGEKLGTGGFSNVFILKDVRLRKSNNDNTNADDESYDSNEILQESHHGPPPSSGDVDSLQRFARRNLAKLVKLQKGEASKKEETENNNSNNNNERFVVKFLIPNLDKKRMRQGALDIVREAKFLSNLQHPNIVTLRGISEGGANAFEKGTVGGFFLIVDRLKGTLLEQRDEWKKDKGHKPSGGLMKTILRRSKSLDDYEKDKIRRAHKKHLIRLKSEEDPLSCPPPPPTGLLSASPEQQCLLERLKVVHELTAPLEYLHSFNIVYRDLKPENIGFALNGKLKLFDFGLAVELSKFQPISKDTPDLYNMREFGGTHPYMSPEMTLHKPYGLSTDVYSFSIIFWEILRLKDPFGDIMEQEYFNRVMHGNERPHVKTTHWPSQVCDLMTKCWDPNPSMRPTMKEVRNILSKAIQQFEERYSV